MTLHPNWRQILRHAWSVRFLGLAALFDGVNASVPYLDGLLPVPPGMFAALAGLSSVAALISRVVYQETVHDPNS